MRTEEDLKAYRRRYYLANRERLLAANTAREKTYNPRTRRSQKLRSMYGITIEEYEVMHAEQHGVCKVCGRPNISGRKLDIDHDHATGKIRGLLCIACNTAIGQAQDNPSRLRALAIYLETHATNHSR